MKPVQWDIVASRLAARLAPVVGKREVSRLVELGSLYAIEPKHPQIEPSDVKLLRSIETLVARQGAPRVRKGIVTLLERVACSIESYLPSTDDFQRRLLAPFEGATRRFSLQQVSLCVSSPTAFPLNPELSIVHRSYHPDRSLALKLKLSLFLDNRTDAYWETGCVDVARSLGHLLSDLRKLREASPVTVKMIRRSAHNAVRMIEEMPSVVGLDTTPSHFHVIPLSRFIGGKFVEPLTFESFEATLDLSLEYSLARQVEPANRIDGALMDLARTQVRQGKVSPLLISLLFERKLLLDYRTREPLRWVAPRMIYAKSWSLDSELKGSL